MRIRIRIFIWTKWKKSICIDFVHKITFWAFFSPTCMYKKLGNFGTIPPGVTNLVSKCAGNSKENCHKVSWRELCALQSYRAKCRGGAIMPPPPSLIRVKLGLISIIRFIATLYETGPKHFEFLFFLRE